MQCEFSYDGHFPSKDSILISCSLFRLKNSYRSFDVYAEGLQRLQKECSKLDYHLLVYFDHSVEDEPIFKTLKASTDNNVLFCKYNCPRYQDKDGYHLNAFGMFVRFLPFFLPQTLRYTAMYVSDIDLGWGELKLYLHSFLQTFIRSRYSCAFVYKIGYEYRYGEEFSVPGTTRCFLANFYAKRPLVPVSVMQEFVDGVLQGDQNLEESLQNLYQKLVKYPEDHPNHQVAQRYNKNLFGYGVDEYFINKCVIPTLSYDDVGCFYLHDNLKKHLRKLLREDTLTAEQWDSFFDEMIGERTEGTFEERLEYLIKYVNTGCFKRTFVEKMECYFSTVSKLVKRVLDICREHPPALRDLPMWLNNLALSKKKGGRIQILYCMNEEEYRNVDLDKYVKIYPISRLI